MTGWRMDSWMDEFTEWPNGRQMDGWTTGRMNGWMNGWLDGWTNEWMNEWMDEWMNDMGLLNA